MHCALQQRPAESKRRLATSSIAGSDRKRSDAGGAGQWSEAVDDRCFTLLQCTKGAASERVAARNSMSFADRSIVCPVPTDALWVLVKTERDEFSSAGIGYWGR